MASRIVCIRDCFIGNILYRKGDPVSKPKLIPEYAYKHFKGFEKEEVKEEELEVTEVDDVEENDDDEKIFD